MIARVFTGLLLTATLSLGSALAEEINPVLGKSADYTLRETEFERMLGGQSPELQQELSSDPVKKGDLVRQLLMQKAVAARARKEGFDRQPDVRERLANLMDEFIANEYLAKVVAAGAVVQEDQLKRYYKEHGKDFVVPEKIRVRQIFIEAPADQKTDQDAKTLARAEVVQQRLKKGEDFAKLAAELSDDADSGKRGGEVGIMTPGASNSEEFEKAAFGLKVGETSGPVKTPFGYHIIRVDERWEKRPATFQESGDLIRTRLLDEARRKKVQEFLELVSREADLKVFVGTEGKAEEGKRPGGENRR